MVDKSMKVLKMKFCEGIAQPIKFLILLEVLGSDSSTHIKIHDKLIKACHPSSGEARQESPSLRLIGLIGGPQAIERP